MNCEEIAKLTPIARVKPLLGELLPSLILLFVLLVASQANAAVRPVSPDALKSAQTAKDTPKPTCINATTHMRLMIYPDGKAVVVGRFTIYEACKL